MRHLLRFSKDMHGIEVVSSIATSLLPSEELKRAAYKRCQRSNDKIRISIGNKLSQFGAHPKIWIIFAIGEQKCHL
jgi:hypothetical protein